MCAPILGNDIAQETFGILRKRASAAKKHKLRVLVYLSLKGIRVVNEKNATVLMESPINKITYFTRDLGCHRTYGIVVCVTDLQYRFVAIKAERSAEVVVATIQELFDVAALAQKRKSRKERTATMLLLNERAIDVPIGKLIHDWYLHFQSIKLEGSVWHLDRFMKVLEMFSYSMYFSGRIL